MFPRAAAGNRRARLAVRHGIEGWAMLIATLVALLDPQAFVLSDGLVEEAASFFEPLRRCAADLCPLPPDFRIGDLGAQSGLAGAAVARPFLVTGSRAGCGPGRIGRLIPRPGQRPYIQGG
jgi:predicted NBD/HSP70 family sugar kinase